MKKMLNVIFIVMVAIVLTSCKGAIEIDKKAFVHGAEILKEKNGKYNMIFEVCNPKKAIDKNNIFTEIIVMQGDSLLHAIRDTIKTYGRKLYWGHTQTLLINEDILKEDYRDVFDMLLRDSEVRENMWFLVTRTGDKNPFILDTRENVAIAHSISEMLKNAKYNPKFLAMDVFEFVKDTETEGINPSSTFVTQNYMDNKYFPRIYGAAIFNDERLVGGLDEEETEILYILKNREINGMFFLDEKNSAGNGEFTLEIIKNKCKIKPHYNIEKNKISFDIDVKCSVIVAENKSGGEKLDKELIKRIEADYTKVLKERIEKVLKKLSIEYKADTVGLGRIFNTKYPKVWRERKNTWNDGLSEIQFNIKTGVEIHGTGLLN